MKLTPGKLAGLKAVSDARGVIAGGVPLAFEKVWTPLYRKAPLLSRAATVEGHRMLESLGFSRGATFKGKSAPHLHMYPHIHLVTAVLGLVSEHNDAEQNGP